MPFSLKRTVKLRAYCISLQLCHLAPLILSDVKASHPHSRYIFKKKFIKQNETDTTIFVSRVESVTHSRTVGRRPFTVDKTSCNSAFCYIKFASISDTL